MPTAVQEEFGITAAADAITAQKTPMEHAEHTLHHRISDGQVVGQTPGRESRDFPGTPVSLYVHVTWFSFIQINGFGIAPLSSKVQRVEESAGWQMNVNVNASRFRSGDVVRHLGVRAAAGRQSGSARRQSAWALPRAHVASANG